MPELAQTNTRICDFLRLFMDEYQVLIVARILRVFILLASLASIITFFYVIFNH